MKKEFIKTENLKKVLLRCLEESGKILKDGFGTAFKVRKKGPVNLVTEIDTAAEAKIVSILQLNFPKHRILTEESAPFEQPSLYRWIVDPLDGTTNYAHRLPLCCVSVGVEYEGKMILGGIYNPLMDELYFAEKGGGAHLNGKRIFVSRVNHLVDSLIVTGFPYDRRERADFYLKYFKNVMQNTQGIRRLGAAALDLAYVASGRFDAFWELNLKPWDIAAGALIVEEAGGKVTNFGGKRLEIDQPIQLLASNKKIHSRLLGILQQSH